MGWLFGNSKESAPTSKSEVKRLNSKLKAAGRMQERNLRSGDKNALKASNTSIRGLCRSLDSYR